MNGASRSPNRGFEFRLPMPSLPNLLSTRRGRLTGFFFLYLSEGLPQGFTGTAVALEFKRRWQVPSGEEQQQEQALLAQLQLLLKHQLLL
jgi:hypothetical protein